MVIRGFRCGQSGMPYDVSATFFGLVYDCQGCTTQSVVYTSCTTFSRCDKDVQSYDALQTVCDDSQRHGMF